jgi:hypothetical protein
MKFVWPGDDALRGASVVASSSWAAEKLVGSNLGMLWIWDALGGSRRVEGGGGGGSGAVAGLRRCRCCPWGLVWNDDTGEYEMAQVKTRWQGVDWCSFSGAGAMYSGPLDFEATCLHPAPAKEEGKSSKVPIRADASMHGCN